MSAATSRRIIVDAVCKDLGLFSISERSGSGTQVFQQSLGFHSRVVFGLAFVNCVCCFFMETEEGRAELQYLFS